MERDPLDKKGLIPDSLAIEGIDEGECRSIFLDWALSLPDGTDNSSAITTMLDRYRDDYPDHPMIKVLTEGLAQANAPKRRGGWRSRPR